MKPKPFSELNHLTVPSAMYLPPSQESLGLHRAAPAVPGRFPHRSGWGRHARVSFRERETRTQKPRPAWLSVSVGDAQHYTPEVIGPPESYFSVTLGGSGSRT